jgi:uncharacterized protein (DUF488 family)
MNPQFNRESLAEALSDKQIVYVFLGKELGARSEDLSCYLNGKVQYERLAQTQLFRIGLERIRRGAKSYRIAMMCAEREPIECHRAILIARYLEPDLEVRHILSDGTLQSQKQLVERLLHRFQLHTTDMFRSNDEIVTEGYRRQAETIAYQLDSAPSSTDS